MNQTRRLVWWPLVFFEEMAKRRVGTASTEQIFDPGKANPKQLEFFAATEPRVCYGGAKGGGKTWAVRVKAVLGAMIGYPGIRILIMRAHYPELEENHIRPICAMVPANMASYNSTTKIMSFQNGSYIKFGHWTGEESELEYNGKEYDWIFIDEATQFSERAYNFLCGCLRGTTKIPRRMYLTCNPGGIGHNWVKRLFISREYITNAENPEENENPDDYRFIFATAEDNLVMVENSPGYLQSVAKMPNAKAYRYGDWDAIGGNYFKDFSRKKHTMAPFHIPEHWTLYRSLDYGLDMLACMWWAVDEDGRCWCYREVEQKDLIVSDAAAKILENTVPGEKIAITYAPPDMWNRQKVTDKTMAEVFTLSGVPLMRADNNRVQGHMLMLNMMAPIPLHDPAVKALFPAGKAPDKLPALMFFDTLKKVISDIESIQADDRNPNDCAKQPHEITHTVDGVRYFCISRAQVALRDAPVEEPDEDESQDYESYMCGGSASASYISC